MLGLALALTLSQTIVVDQRAADRLSGTHPFTLQWLSFKKPAGTAIVTIEADTWSLSAEQRVDARNFITVKGTITRIEEKAFELDGEIRMQVAGNHGDQLRKRTERFHFRATGKRQYWRLKEMELCGSDATDYVDVFFEQTKSK